MGSCLQAALREAGRMGQAALDMAQRIRNGPPIEPMRIPRDWVVLDAEDCLTSSSDDTTADEGFEGFNNGGLFDAEPLSTGYVEPLDDGESDDDPEAVQSGGESWGGESWGTYGPGSDSDVDVYEDARTEIYGPLPRGPLPPPVPYSCTPPNRAEAGTITVYVDPACRRGRDPPPPPPSPVGTADHATLLPSLRVASALVPSASSAQTSSSVAGPSSRQPPSPVAGPSSWRASFLARRQAARGAEKAARLASFLGETRPEPAPKRVENPPKEDQPKEDRMKDVKPKEIRPKEVKPKEAKSKEIRPKEIRPKKVQPEEAKPKEAEPKEVQPEEDQPVLPEYRAKAIMPGAWDTTDDEPKLEFDAADSVLKERIAQVKKHFRRQKRKADDAAGTTKGDGEMPAGDT